MKLKILTLNIWRYYGDWETRKKKIVEFILNENPDFVFLQEVFDDLRFNRPKNNQAVQLNKELGFKNCIFDNVEKVKSERGEKLIVPVFDGLTCLTNFDILKHKLIKLKKQKDDKHKRGLQIITSLFKGQKLTFFHPHFSNKDDWAKLHLIETIKLAKLEKNHPIILGDLNIKNTKDIFEVSNKIYKNSYDFKKYISYPNKNETLDYVLIPRNRNFTFVSVQCAEYHISDHNPLVVMIEI